MVFTLNNLLKRPNLNSNNSDLFPFSYVHDFYPTTLNLISSKLEIQTLHLGLIDLFEFAIQNLYFKHDKLLLFPQELQLYIPKTWSVNIRFYKYSSNSEIVVKRKKLLIHCSACPLIDSQTIFRLEKLNSIIGEYQDIYIYFHKNKNYTHWSPDFDEKYAHELLVKIAHLTKNLKFITLAEIEAKQSFIDFDFYDLDETRLICPHHELKFDIRSKGVQYLEDKLEKSTDKHQISIYHSLYTYPDLGHRFDMSEVMLHYKLFRGSSRVTQKFLSQYCQNLVTSAQ